ncbi:slo-interacting protein 1 isoform X2 [Eupeodes corollae]|nr:slo-interacting protein 1 isoform X2 [Eupeodes corollae]
MPHEEAVQMFLKASEPILVEVRRRSYNTTTDAENSNNHKYLEKSNELSQQLQQQQSDPRKHSSPTKMSTKTSAELQQTDWPISKTTENSEDVVDSLKFQSLVISSSKSSTDIDNCANLKLRQSGEAIVAGVDKVGCLPNAAANSRTSSSALGADNQTQNRGSMHENSAAKSRHTSVSSITSSPVRSTPPSPLKESLTKPSAMLPLSEEDDKNSKVLISIGIQTDNFTSDFIFNGSSILNSEQIIENDHNLFSECLAPEIDIEEITLRKSEGNERLGLTVCYSSGGGNGSGSDDTDTCTEVYISDIVADSIAGRDGRLRQGDQILQVNGKDVSNKEETETLIAENNNAVTLLVSRYLYGDDDEYQEQGDYYEEDEPNMDYAKCFLENYIVSEDLLKSAVKNNQDSPDKKQQKEQFQLPEQQPPIRCMTDAVVPSSSDNIPATTTLGSSISRDPLNHQNIRAHLEQVNQEIAILDSRVEIMMMSQKKNIDPSAGVVTQKPLQHSQSQSQIQQEPQLKETIAMPIMDYDTEHIYETIPEDSESEPFYCSPYESSEHQNRIEQWLDMQDGSDLNETRMRSLQNHKHQSNQQQQHHENLSIWTKVKNGTLRSTNSSAGDDHENSSSAYNTGGSCNSNTMTPLTLELNTSNYRDREFNPHSQSTLILCSTKHNVSPINETPSTQILHRLPLMHNSSQELQSSSIINQQRNLKDKLPSPSHSSLKPAQPILPNKKIFPTSQKNAAADIAKSTQNNINTPIPAASNTMYTNVANLHQTMLLQQQLFRQALIHQRVPSNSVPCPQFTAPNLSQYHFVSSQEVSTVKLNTHPNEEHMVWKVKRRQDGSRYIVRRPARNRFLRNRALRISAERNDQTTEDDTISEIKTGRYWTKEERKKHIERARERRQRQQIIITNKNNEISMQPPLCSAVSNLNSEAAQKNVTICGGDSVVIQQNSQQQQKLIPSVQSPAATTGTKIHRQSTPSSTTKKLVKKNTTNSPVDVNNSNTPLVTSNTSVTGTLTTSTTTPNGTRMFQGTNVGIGTVADNTSSYQTRVTHPPL